MSKQATGIIQQKLGKWTLGNLGESSMVCKENNLRLYDTMTLWCPSGTTIQTLEEFGLQKKDAEKDDNTCPQIVEQENEDESKQLKLDLDDQCSLEGLRREFNDYYKTMMKQFRENCKGKETCDMYVRNIDWPGPCREKIGIRLEVVNIPVVRYRSNITTVEQDFRDARLDGLDIVKGASQNSETIEANACNGTDSNGDNCTNTVSSYIEYEQAFQYVISDKSTSFFLYAVTECKNEAITLGYPFDMYGFTLSRKTVGLTAVLVDLLYMTMFLGAIWVFQYFVKLDGERHKKLLYETCEFSVQVQNLPELTQDYPFEQMKTELWDHFITILKQQPQMIEKLTFSDEERACEIIDIQFAMSDYQYLSHVVKIKKLSQEVEKLEIKIDESGYSEKKYDKLEIKKNKLLAKIDDLKAKYFENMEQIGRDNQAVSAFITFRSMEGVERAIHGFKSNWLQRKWFTLFYCCTSQKRKTKLFKNKWLHVEQAVEPELLIWENFGVSYFSRFFRIILYLIFVLFMLLVCFYTIAFLEAAQNEAQNEL